MGAMAGDPEGIDPESSVLLSHLGDILRKRVSAHDISPFVVGLAGPVSVGKSTLAAKLLTELEERRDAGSVSTRFGPAEVLGTDGFLYPNDELADLGLELRKGFPESYDKPLVERTLDSLRAGREVSVPVYSHETYDIVPGAARVIDRPAVLILEGVNALQFRSRLDLAIYLDAPVGVIEEWYVARLVELVADAPPGSFYAGWAGFTGEEVDALARDIWGSINAVNLAECIEPTRAFADLVVEKGPDHALLCVRVCAPEI